MAAARKTAALDRSGSIRISRPASGPGLSRQIPGSPSSTSAPAARTASTVIRIWGSEGSGGPTCRTSTPFGHRAPVSSRPETNCEDADASMVTAPPAAVPPWTVKGSPPRPPSSMAAPTARSASMVARMGRLRAGGSPSKMLLPDASVATGGTNRMTVPASPQSIRTGCASGLSAGSDDLPGRGAGVTSQSSPVFSIRAPSACSAAAMSAVSRARNGARSLDGLSASAASTRARLVSDFEPGTATVASTGRAALGASQCCTGLTYRDLSPVPAAQLGREAMEVTREEGDLPDVRRPDEPCHPPLETDREAAMGRHAVLEGGEVPLVEPGLLTAGRKRRHVVLVAVQSLPAGHQFEPAKKQVEGVGILRPCRIGMGIKRPLDHRIAGDGDELRAVLLHRPVGNPPLVRGCQVGLRRQVLADVLTDHRERVCEVHRRDGLGYDRQGDIEQIDLCRAPCADFGHHARDGVAQDSDDVEMVGDEAQLRVERGVLGEVARRVMRLRPEHRTDLVHPFEHPHEHLLVELRALGEIGLLAEVVDG